MTLAVFCALAIDFAGVVHSVWRHGHYIGDFTVFWTAPHVASVYDFDAVSHAQDPMIGGYAGPRPFAYPPSFLLLLKPFGVLPFFVALGAWITLGVAALAWSLRGEKRWPLVVVAPPLFLAVVTGQVLIVWAALIGAVRVIDRRPGVAGGLLALAALIKPQAVLLAPLALVAARQWRALIAAILCGGAVGGVAVAIQGPELWLDWLRALPAFTELIHQPWLLRRGVTPATLAFHLRLTGPAAAALALGGALLGIACVWAAFRRGEWRLVALVAGSLLCSPYAMPYELVPLLPAAAAMLAARESAPPYWLAGFLAISMLAPAFTVVLLAVVVLFALYKPERSRVTIPAPA